MKAPDMVYMPPDTFHMAPSDEDINNGYPARHEPDLIKAFWKEAAKKANEGKVRSQFIVKKNVPIYPDTLVWVRDFSYSYNEPMTKRYFSHPAFRNYPVVGVNWNQASVFCEWRTQYLNSFLD